MMKILIGPELFWLLLFGAANLMAKFNVPPTKGMDKLIENSWFWVPLLVLLTFALWYIPLVEKRWLLLRVWVVCLVGGHFVLDKVMSAYSEQGPGIGTAYIIGMLLVFIALFAGTIFVNIKF